MPLVIDPEGREITALERVARWRGARVLEIGCGDGRLSMRLARLGAQVVAIDPSRSEIRTARRQLPKRLANRIEYHVGSAEKLHQPPSSFDIAIFSWSL